VDSSLDWGQDLPGLKKWLDQQEENGPVYLSYFGTASPGYYGINAIWLPSYPDRIPPREPPPLTRGIYCLSATMLQTVYVLAPGGWNDRYEQQYQQLGDFFGRYARTRHDPKRRDALLRQVGNPNVANEFRLFEHLRFARLCAYLRQREPTDEVCYSILIYRLSDRDIEQALTGPIVESWGITSSVP
jgi:hypothetical protein